MAEDQLHYGLGYSTSTNYTTTILAGAVYNSYRLNIYAQIFDNDGAYAIYELNNFITVTPDLSNLSLTIDSIISRDPFFLSNQVLSQGSFLSSLQEFQKLASVINQQSLEDKVGLIMNDSFTIFPKTYGPLANYAGVLSVRIGLKKFINSII